MPLERFTGGRRSYRPAVSITKQGMISFNAGSYHRFPLAKYQHAVLFFDNVDRSVGIMLTNDAQETGAVKLRHRAAGADVSGKSFLDCYGIQYADETRKYYDPQLTDFEGNPMILFRLATFTNNAEASLDQL